MTSDPLHVLLVGPDDARRRELETEEDLTLTHVASLSEYTEGTLDALVLDLAGIAPLQAVHDARAIAPDAAILVITDAAHGADGTVARHAGAEEHLTAGEIPAGMLARAIRYAVAMRRLRQELATVDDETGMPNLRGFAPIAEHHLRMADRAQTPVVFVFVRLDDLVEITASLGQDGAAELARDASSVVLEAVRESDVPARIAPDTFCVLLAGSAEGAESLVLSRLVEAIAVHDARRDRPRSLALSVGSALYEPKSGVSLAAILEAAGRRLNAGAPERA
jgi:diguanylate cyclase (GGDEF)-like protein